MGKPEMSHDFHSEDKPDGGDFERIIYTLTPLSFHVSCLRPLEVSRESEQLVHVCPGLFQP